MTEGMRVYPEYKPSSMVWAGDIPSHWATPRVKHVLRERSQKGFPNEPLLAATQTKGVVRKEEYENRTVLALKDLHLLKLVCERDFVISLRSFQGGIEYARHRGIISPAYTILFPYAPSTHGYLAWLFKSKPYIENLTLHVTGIRQGQNIDYERLKRSQLPLPPPDEQAAIVRFLDHVDRRIRRYIRAKRQLIALLNEQKQAIIHRAVTRGLDPNVRLKQSGVEWLGDVPQGWGVTRVKFASRKISKGDTPSNFGKDFVDDGPVRFIKIENIGEGELIETPRYSIDFDSHEKLTRSQLRENDIVFAIAGATTGKCAIVRAHQLPANTNQAVAFIRPNDRVVPEFLVAWLHQPKLKEAMWLQTVQSAQPNLSMEELGNLPMLLPPMDEQNRILDFLHKQRSKLENAIRHAQQEIVLLGEYRTRLIADAVTGKIDVRAAAARLPDVTDETDANADELIDGEEPIDDAELDTEPEEVEA